MRRRHASGKVAATDGRRPDLAGVETKTWKERNLLLREPHRLLFPLGALLASAGVLPWILFALGFSDAYRPIFHSVVFRSMFHPLAEIEGFLTCFAVGSLFTVLPRRTSTAPPAAWQMAVAIAAPISVVICAALQSWRIGQIAWLALLAMVTGFSLTRFRASQRDVLPCYVWVALAIIMGATGAILATVGDALGEAGFWLHEVGRSLLVQGLFTGLALGTAPLLFSSVDRGALPPRAPDRRWAFAAHVFGASLFFASFWVDQRVSLQLGFALRAAVTMAVVVPLLRAPRPARASELQGRAVQTALWMIPLGNAWVALAPMTRRAGMHVIYLGCLAMLVLVLSTYVVPTGADRLDSPLPVRPWQLGIGVALLALALISRIFVEWDPPNFNYWLAISCASFMGAMIFNFRAVSYRLAQLLPDAQNGPTSERQADRKHLP